MVVIWGVSAWEYHTTPPVIRDTGVSLEAVMKVAHSEIAIPSWVFKPRANACEAARLVQNRLFFDLKNIKLPICVFVENGASTDATRIISPTRMPRFLPQEELTRLGENLYVTSPRLTLLHLAQSLPWQQLALRMLEACGIYASTDYTSRSIPIVKEIGETLSAQEKTLFRTPAISEFCDEFGSPIELVDKYGNPLGWSPCVNRFGRITNLWKRPPLTSTHEIGELLDACTRVRGLPDARTALSQVQDGCGSPLEAQLFLLLCASRRYGGEQWERPSLNRHVEFTKAAIDLSGQSFCVCDLLWADQKVAIEAKGKDYHADREGFEEENGRRAALESMGFSVFDIVHSQMFYLDRFDTLVKTFSERLKFPIQSRTPAFLRHRKELHDMIFLHDRTKPNAKTTLP